MTPELNALMNEHGFITRPEVLRFGFDDRAILEWKRVGAIVRVGPGLYASPRYERMHPEEKHVLRARAVATRMGSQVAFTHQSAALLHGLPVYGLDLGKLHVTRTDGGRGRSDDEVVHHRSVLGSRDIDTTDGLVITTLARTVWDIAAAASAESAIVTADAALHAGLVDDAELLEIVRRHPRWRGSRQAKVALSLTNRRAESPAESRARYIFHELGLPRPVSQHKVFGPDGLLLGIVDFAFLRERLIVEVDGMAKYGSGNDLAREKWCEDAIRAMGWRVVRLVWDQLRPEVRGVLEELLFEALRDAHDQWGHLAA